MYPDTLAHCIDPGNSILTVVESIENKSKSATVYSLLSDVSSMFVYTHILRVVTLYSLIMLVLATVECTTRKYQRP